MHIRYVLPIASVVFLTLVGCEMPRDPEGTLDRVRGGTLRVGVSENKPWTSWRGESPTGIEVDLVEELAAQLHATVEWKRDGESNLLEALHKHELDVVIGGLTDDTPWGDKIGISQPYYESQGRGQVLAVPPGENQWLLALETFLQSRRDKISQRIATESRR